MSMKLLFHNFFQICHELEMIISHNTASEELQFVLRFWKVPCLNPQINLTLISLVIFNLPSGKFRRIISN
jgi:hypothetical protein